MNEIITRKEVARILNVSSHCLPLGLLRPPHTPFELGPNRIVWTRSEILEWLEKQKSKRVIPHVKRKAYIIVVLKTVFWCAELCLYLLKTLLPMRTSIHIYPLFVTCKERDYQAPRYEFG